MIAKTDYRKSTFRKAKRTEHDVVIKIKGLRKSFDDNEVLKDINLDVYQGENLVIIGRSGTGKSVLIKCMVGLLKPDEGEINVLGYDVTSLNQKELNELRLQVGFSFQGSALYDSMTVRENLEFPVKRNLGIYDQNKLNEMIHNSLSEVGLIHAADQFPAELSGGMKKRVGIARTLILQPKIMLYDEPTAGLDPTTSREINELIIEVRKKHDTTSIIITHDVSCARETGDRIVALVDGTNKIEGTFSELQESDLPEIKSFFNY